MEQKTRTVDSNEPITLSSMCLSIYSDLMSSISHEILAEAFINEQVTRAQFGSLIHIEKSLQPIIEPSSNSLNVFNNNNGNGIQSQTPSQTTSRIGTPSTELLTRTQYYEVAGRDIFGNAKVPDSNRFFVCTNCSRKIAGNRFAAHIDRCLGGRQRK